MDRTRNRLLACAALAALLPLAAPPAVAALYKWVDANGRTVYSDQVPPGVKAEQVGAAPPPANPNAAKDLANQDAEFRKRQMERADDAKKADKARTALAGVPEGPARAALLELCSRAVHRVS